MNLQSNQGAIEFPKTDQPVKPEKKKPGKKVNKVYYKQDFAGLWVFAQQGDAVQLLTPYPITDYGYKVLIKKFIDENY